MYVMRSSGPNRRGVQILNQFDPCCYAATGALDYMDVVKNAVARIGPGSYELLVDSTHDEHKISQWALEKILEDLED